MNKFKVRKGSALIISVFISMIAGMMTITMMGMTDTNINQISDNKNGLTAYYAAEAGLEEVKSFFSRDISNMGMPINDLSLPEVQTPYILANNAEYWVDSMTYTDNNSSVIVDVVGKYGDAYRKIRARLNTEIPSVFNDYGLLTDGRLRINGSKILNMSVHANSGLNFNGGNELNNNAVATQSDDPTADPPHAEHNPVGGYVPYVDVPLVPIDELRAQAQEDGIFLDINQKDLYEQINNAPDGSKIYITGGTNIKKSSIDISGNMEGKTIFVDGNVTANIDGSEPLSNVNLIISGDMRVNGSVDVISSNPDEIDVVFACGGDVKLNGSREFTSLFWANGRFTQNGSSLSGRVIANEAIFLNGSFILTNSDNLADKDIFEKVINTYSWQLVTMD